MKKITALLLSVTMLLSVIPAFAEDVITREYVIDCFVEAVGEENLPAGAVALGSYADGNQVSAEYAHSMGLAVANGLIKGYDDNTLRPDAPITRLEALLILGRALPDVPELRGTTDFYDVPAWAEDEIDRLYRGELVNGYGDGRLGSDDYITGEQVELFVSRVEAAFDGQVSLKDDFYTAVNSDYIIDHALKDGEYCNSVFSAVSDEVDRILIDISEELADKASASQQSGEEIEAGRFYTMALNEQKNQSTSVAALKSYLNDIDSGTRLGVIGYINGSIVRDIQAPVLFDVFVPCKTWGEKSYRVIDGIYVDYLDSGIERYYWEKDDTVYNAYRDYVEKILTLLGVPQSELRAGEIADIQKAVALAEKSYAQSVRAGIYEEDGEQYIYDWEELQTLYGDQFTNPVTNTLYAIDDGTGGMAGRDHYIINDIAKMNEAVKQLKATDLETLKALCKFNLVQSLMQFMPKAYRDAYFELQSVIVGGTVTETPQEYAADLTAALYSDLYEEKFLERAGDLNTEYLNSLISSITASFDEMFRSCIWLNPSTVGKASAKLQKIVSHIGEKSSEGDDSDYHPMKSGETVLSTILNYAKRYGGNYYSTYISVNSPSPCYTVNAEYSPYDNEMYVYAGFLREPMYNPNLSEEENLAGVGFVIAHEISHAFDENGSYFDDKGNLKAWWSDSDYEKFDAILDRLTEYYNGYEVAPGVTVNGVMTRDENIADIVAMRCVIDVAKKKSLDLDKVFRTYARLWAQASNEAYDVYSAKCDTHSPAKVRVNAVLSCFDEFYEVYGITEGDGMFVAPENRIKIF